MFRRTLWFLLSAALIGAAVLCLIEWSTSWNKPKTRTDDKIATGEVHYGRSSVEATITCTCPPVLIEARKETFLFTFHLKPLQTPGPSPLVPTPPSPVGVLPAPSASEPTIGVARQKAETIYVWLDSVNATAELPNGWASDDIGPDDQLPSGLLKSIAISITPSGSGPVAVVFHFQAAVLGHEIDTDLGALQWMPETRPVFFTAMVPFISAGVVFGVACGAFFLIDRRLRQLRNRTEQRLTEAQNIAAANPNQTHFAWEIAKIKLEAYFDRNLIQVNLVFWVAVFVMVVGFSFVLAGVLLAFKNPKDVSTAELAAISGIITQFIGATFMVIYRSTMSQANDFMNVLERINTVGMAVYELEGIPDSPPDLKNTVRAHVVELLLSGNQSAARGMNLKPEERASS